MTAYKITIGASTSSPTYTFLNDAIESINEEKAIGVIGDELSIDTFTAVLRYTIPSGGTRLTADYGTPVHFYIYDNTTSTYVLTKKYYVDKIERTGKTQYTVSCCSLIGLLDTAYHVGGVYFGSGNTFRSVLDSILSPYSSYISYEVDSQLSSTKVYGRLPYDTARNNLHNLLFAYNASMRAGDSSSDVTKIKFMFLGTDGASATVIDDNDIYSDGSVEYGSMPTKVNITEHSFSNQITVTGWKSLYDNSSTGDVADEEVVVFDEPIVNTTYGSGYYTDGSLDIETIGNNYAIVSGVGILYGKCYVHQTKTIGYSTGVGGVANEVSVSDNELITLQNSHNIANRLIDYYGHGDTHTIDIRMTNQKVGNLYSFKNAFGESQTGIIYKISSVMSSFIRSTCEIVSGLTYPGRGIIYTQKTICIGSGSWTIPTGTNNIRVVLIGGGHGGDSGYAGTAGSDGTTSGGSGGKGGNGGDPGEGGKVYSFNLDVTPGTTLTYSAGSYGSGGDGDDATNDNNISGSSGGNSTIRYNGVTYSSSNGCSSDSGYTDPFTGIVYARPGTVSGTAGGAGGDGGSYSDDSLDENLQGESGESVGSYSGGSGGSISISGFDYLYRKSTGYSILKGTSGKYFSVASTETATSDSGTYVASGDTIIKIAQKYQGTGGGGGACATSSGLNGKSAGGSITLSSSSVQSSTYKSYYNSSGVLVMSKPYTYTYTATVSPGANGYTSSGGAGRKPSVPSHTKTYGDGGYGGHGGSGGGGGGAYYRESSTASSESSYQSSTSAYNTVLNTYNLTVDCSTDTTTYPTGKGGGAGAGGNGESGAAGCIIIYYY